MTSVASGALVAGCYLLRRLAGAVRSLLNTVNLERHALAPTDQGE
jgi:hypothetical protein